LWISWQLSKVLTGHRSSWTLVTKIIFPKFEYHLITFGWIIQSRRVSLFEITDRLHEFAGELGECVTNIVYYFLGGSDILVRIVFASPVICLSLQTWFSPFKLG
jgi:hypothetical protein